MRPCCCCCCCCCRGRNLQGLRLCAAERGARAPVGFRHGAHGACAVSRGMLVLRQIQYSCTMFVQWLRVHRACGELLVRFQMCTKIVLVCPWWAARLGAAVQPPPAVWCPTWLGHCASSGRNLSPCRHTTCRPPTRSTIRRFWDCCGAEQEDAPGCCTGRHVTYDDPDD